MLIEKKLSENDVVTIKFISGEEIIGRLMKDEDTTYLVARPLAMQLVPSPQNPGEHAVMFAPFMIAVDAKESYLIQKSAVAAIAKPRADAVTGYLKQTTGLDIPVTSGLVGL